MPTRIPCVFFSLSMTSNAPGRTYMYFRPLRKSHSRRPLDAGDTLCACKSVPLISKKTYRGTCLSGAMFRGSGMGMGADFGSVLPSSIRSKYFFVVTMQDNIYNAYILVATVNNAPLYDPLTSRLSTIHVYDIIRQHSIFACTIGIEMRFTDAMHSLYKTLCDNSTTSDIHIFSSGNPHETLFCTLAREWSRARVSITHHLFFYSLSGSPSASLSEILETHAMNDPRYVSHVIAQNRAALTQYANKSPPFTTILFSINKSRLD